MEHNAQPNLSSSSIVNGPKLFVEHGRTPARLRAAAEAFLASIPQRPGLHGTCISLDGPRGRSRGWTLSTCEQGARGWEVFLRTSSAKAMTRELEIRAHGSSRLRGS